MPDMRHSRSYRAATARFDPAFTGRFACVQVLDQPWLHGSHSRDEGRGLRSEPAGLEERIPIKNLSLPQSRSIPRSDRVASAWDENSRGSGAPADE